MSEGANPILQEIQFEICAKKEKEQEKKKNALIPSFVHSSNQLQVSMFYDE